MKSRFAIPCLLACASIAAFAQAASAQDGTHARTATYPSAEGQVIVQSSQPGPQPSGPAPAFASLDRRGAGFLTAEDATAYPLLANDFIYADANRDGKISRTEYERWARSH